MMVPSRFAIALLVLTACGGSPYPGFKEVASDVHLCYIKLGEGEVLPSDSDSVQVRFRIAELGADPGSFRSMQAWYSVKDLRQGAMLPVLRRWHEGDSMSVIAAACIATSVPVPIAMPTSAAASAGASLTPSPTIATT